ncbi:MAG: Uma2 family endonuclease [Aureliella sp.]
MTIASIPSTSSSPTSSIPVGWTLSDLQRHLGDIPAERIVLNPPPGFATELDLFYLADRDCLCELEFGTLVEKTMGWYESLLANLISFEISLYLRTHDLGRVLGADGMLKILPGMVKLPDISFISWSRFPNTKLPSRPVPALIPDLAVEVLSDGNSMREMTNKLEMYFDAGVRLVWYVEPKSRSATMWQQRDQAQPIAIDGDLDGCDILPGLSISLQQIFQQADRQGPLSVEPA